MEKKNRGRVMDTQRLTHKSAITTSAMCVSSTVQGSGVESSARRKKESEKSPKKGIASRVVRKDVTCDEPINWRTTSQ